MPWLPVKYSSCWICSKDQKEDFTASVEFGFVFKTEYLKWLCQDAAHQFSRYKYTNYTNTDPCIWPIFQFHVQGKKQYLAILQSFVSTSKINWTYLLLHFLYYLSFVHCFTKKNKKAVFSLKYCSCSHSCHTDQDQICCSSKFISTGMQSRFSNTVAKFQHENMSVHYISMQNLISEAQLSSSKIVEY